MKNWTWRKILGYILFGWPFVGVVALVIYIMTQVPGLGIALLLLSAIVGSLYFGLGLLEKEKDAAKPSHRYTHNEIKR